MATQSIRNETPRRITLVGVDDKKITLAPLQLKEVGETEAFDFDELEYAGILTQIKDTPDDYKQQMFTAVVGVGFWLVVIGSIVVNTGPYFGISADYWTGVVWLSIIALLALIAGVLYLNGTNSVESAIRWSVQTVSLAGILAIGVGLPGATIYYFGGGQELLADVWPASTEIVLTGETGAAKSAGEATISDAGKNANLPLALYGRLIQLAFISIASLLPVLLFFLFDRYCLATLRKRLYISLFRLDRSLQTTSEIYAKYGAQIDEAYGPLDLEKGRLSPGNRWPVLVCALVITIGWTVALAPVAAYSPTTGADVIASLLPQPNALVFGFLGVYFYSLGLIALRYARGDLKPKAYTQIMVRIFIVAVLSWVLETINPGDKISTLILAFLFGITPGAFFLWLKEMFRGVIPAKIIPQPTLPLQELEGIDLYDHGRLESEGIVNVESLAHHELIDLVIETRISVPRLVDWIDQAILYLHLIGGSNKKAREILRDYGIRTATDLMVVWKQACDRGPQSFEALKKLLGGDASLYKLEAIHDALVDDEWMKAVTNWRNEDAREAISYPAIVSNARALEKRGDQELADGNAGNALHYFLRSIEAEDTATARRKAALLMANSDDDIRDPDAARQHAEQAYALAPNEYQGYIELFEVFLAINDPKRANEMLKIARLIVDEWDHTKSRQKEIETKQLEALQAQLDAPASGAKPADPPAQD